MKIPRPNNKFDEFIDVLNGMIASKETNEFQINRIKRDAEKMKSSSPSEAFALLGIISCLNDDIEGMHSNHKNALHYESSLLQKRLYGESLFNLSLFDEAYEYLSEVFNTSDKVDLDLLENLLYCTLNLNIQDDFYIYSDLWKRLTGSTPSVSFFPEDQDAHLECLLTTMDAEIENESDMVEEFDLDLFALADTLVEGVSI